MRLAFIALAPLLLLVSSIANLLTNVFRTCMRACAPPRMATPAVIKFRQDPWVVRGHSKVTSGGSVSRWLGRLSVGFAVAVAIALIALAVAPALAGPVAFKLAFVTFATREMREKRGNLIEQGNAILNTATAEKRGLNAEEQVQFDKLHEEQQTLGKDISRIEAQNALNVEMESRRLHDEKILSEAPQNPAEMNAEQHAAAYAAAFNVYMRFGGENLTPEERSIMQPHRDLNRETAFEGRAQTVTTTAGGYLIPQGFSGKLEENMKAYGGVESVAEVFDTDTGNALPWPTFDDTANSGELLGINTTVNAQDVTYGLVTFNAYKFSSKLVLVPIELMQDSAFNLDDHLAGVLGTRLGRVHNTYETTGTGSSQPQGIVVGSAAGVTAGSATSVTPDELLDLLHSVDPAYRLPAFGAGWMFNDGTLKVLRKLKDGEGRYIWQPGLQVREADTLLGYPYTINQDMAAMTTGLKPILFGGLKKFKVRRVKGFTLLRLNERYADAHQVGFFAFTRMDSKLMDAGSHPAKYITMA